VRRSTSNTGLFSRICGLGNQMIRQGSARTQTHGGRGRRHTPVGGRLARPRGRRCFSRARLGPGTNASRPISQRLVARWSEIDTPLCCARGSLCTHNGCPVLILSQDRPPAASETRILPLCRPHISRRNR
jgi:hypothetical protein